MSLAQHIAEKTKAKKPKKLRIVARARAGNGQGDNSQTAKNLLFQFLPAAARAWVDGLSACKEVWNPELKKYEASDRPDHELRGRSAERIWHNVLGKPVEQVMQLTGNYKELSDLVTELKQSPEAQRLIAAGFFQSLLSNVEDHGEEKPHEGETISQAEPKTG